MEEPQLHSIRLGYSPARRYPPGPFLDYPSHMNQVGPDRQFGHRAFPNLPIDLFEGPVHGFERLKVTRGNSRSHNN